jgi:TPR repeat protein
MPPDSDPAAARLWYRRAAELGAQEANVRLERLEKWTW